MGHHEPKDISAFNEADKPNTIAIYVIAVVTLGFLAATFIGVSIFKDFDDAKVEKQRLEKRREMLAADPTSYTIEKLRKEQSTQLEKIDAALEAKAKENFIK